MKETHVDTLYVDCGLHILMPLEWEQNVHVCVCVLVGTPGCVGRVGWSSKIFNPPPQFSRLGIQGLVFACLFVCLFV